MWGGRVQGFFNESANGVDIPAQASHGGHGLTT
jgi:hypothetical protein